MSVCIYLCVCEIRHFHYLISGYHSNEFSSTVYERNLCTRSKPIINTCILLQCYRAYSVNIDNTDVNM
jgi:hypothetical protein